MYSWKSIRILEGKSQEMYSSAFLPHFTRTWIHQTYTAKDSFGLSACVGLIRKHFVLFSSSRAYMTMWRTI